MVYPWIVVSRRVASTHLAASLLGRFQGKVSAPWPWGTEIEADPRLSREGKAEERKKAAEKALAAFASSRTLARAQESVASVMEKWEAKVSTVVRPPKDHGEAVVAAQIRDRLSNTSDVKDRMAFLEKHSSDPTVASAILLAPSFLSGLSEQELALVRSKIERVALPPDIIGAKAAVSNALAEVERGWRLAYEKIASRGGLAKGLDGALSQPSTSRAKVA
jgi:hypothetical protein